MLQRMVVLAADAADAALAGRCARVLLAYDAASERRACLRNSSSMPGCSTVAGQHSRCFVPTVATM
jgi:hypothetical protein